MLDNVNIFKASRLSIAIPLFAAAAAIREE
jgi:hypothetical protein